MPRKRKTENEDLPFNVYQSGGYYRWEHPRSGKSKGLGRNRAIAIAEGHQYNESLVRMGVDPSTRDITHVPDLGTVIKEATPKILARYKSKLTRRNAKGHLKRMARELGNNPIDCPIPVIASWFEDLPDTTHVRCKTLLDRVYKYAYRQGYIPLTTESPASILENRKLPDAKRERLTLNQFNAIREHAPAWFQTALDLMLHTTLRPGDLCNLRYSQLKGNQLRLTVSKSDKPIAIVLSPAEVEIINASRSHGGLSPYIVHKRHRNGTKVSVWMLSNEFRTIRNRLGIGGDNPPSLYEVRSLSAWLYERSGRSRVDIQGLMAHTDKGMTDHYIDSRRDAVVSVRAGLEL